MKVAHLIIVLAQVFFEKDSNDGVPLKSLNQETRCRRLTGMTRQKEAGLAKVKKDLWLWMRKLKDELTHACNDEVTDINPWKRRLIVDDDDSGEEDEIAVPTSSPTPDPKPKEAEDCQDREGERGDKGRCHRIQPVSQC